MSAADRIHAGGSARHALIGAFAEHAARAPQTVAVRSAGADTTYAALLAGAARFAAALEQHGVGPGDVVALEAARTPAAFALLLAVAATGAAYLPLDAKLADARLGAMLAAARPRLLIGAAALRARLAGAGRWVAPEDLVATRSVLPAHCAGPLAYVLFTSGSTGTPKGVAMRTPPVAGLIAWHVQHPRLGRAARTLQFAPLGFDVSFQEIFSTLATGGTLVVAADDERRDPWALLDLLERERVERVFLPPVALHALADSAAGGARSLALTDVVTAGEQLRITPALRAFCAALPDAVLHNHYGPTETHVVTAHELRGDPARWPDLPPIGRPLPHVRVRVAAADPGAAARERGEAQIADRDAAVAATPDAAADGELLLGGDCLAAGYVGHPEWTAARFFDDEDGRWYRTGDRVRRDADGTLHYLGRLDEQLKIAGHRVEPAEVEAAIERHADVAHAVVVGAGAAGATRLVAHVVARDAALDATALGARLAAHCAVELPEYLRPHAFAVHAALPTTASGKVDRRALAAASGPEPALWLAGAALERQLQHLWETLIGVALQPDANLFDAGARSLTVVRALTELRRHGHVLSVAQAYEHPTIAAQAALLAGARAAPAAERGTRRSDGRRAAFARFAQRGAGA